MPRPVYRVQIKAFGTDFAPGSLVVEFENAKNIGYADYISDVPEAFFTIDQDDPKIRLLRGHKGNAHTLIYRDNDLVWAGWLGEHEANERDAIFYAYGYMAGTFFLATDFNVVYTNVQLDVIASDVWDRAKTDLTNSRLKWITTGTIEAPVTTSGGATPIVLPTYKAFYRKILFVLRDLVAIGTGDTTNVVLTEITPSGTFNFWKNRGSDVSLGWKYPNGPVLGFNEGYAPVIRRNELLAVGVNPNDVLLRYTASDASDFTVSGRLQEPVFFSFVRDSLELERVTKLRLARAKRTDFDLRLRFKSNTIVPPRSGGALFKIGDRAKIDIDRGVTGHNNVFQLIAGYQVLATRGSERVNVLLQERPGT